MPPRRRNRQQNQQNQTNPVVPNLNANPNPPQQTGGQHHQQAHVYQQKGGGGGATAATQHGTDEFRVPYPLDIQNKVQEVLANDWERANRSLIYEYYFFKWSGTWQFDTGKSEFHKACATNGKFNSAAIRREYANFFTRRSVALSRAGFNLVTAKLKSRLAIGLGLDHPTELGFMLDRMTGSPYIPGSSIKGFLRSASRWSVNENGERIWDDDAIEKFFGNKHDATSGFNRGALSFADAFPSAWPEIDVDILTPHYSPYYDPGSNLPPGDWFDPTPSTFLAVKPGRPWNFWWSLDGKLSGGTEPPEPLVDLFARAFAAQGIGAKKSAGYGWFDGVTAQAAAGQAGSASGAAYGALDIKNLPPDEIKKLFEEECKAQKAPGSDIELAKRINQERPDVVTIWKNAHGASSGNKKTVYAKLTKRLQE